MSGLWGWLQGKRHVLPSVGGYVLAGGKSSRMGQDKATLLLGGKPLAEHAVAKLRRLCADVKMLSGHPEHAAFAPTVPDNFPGCGPLSGIEAALSDTAFDWNLILPVDVPFLPTRLLDDWLWTALRPPVGELRVSMLAVSAQAHPTLLIVHRDLGPSLREALRAGDYKVLRVIEAASAAIARDRGVPVEKVFWQAQWDQPRSPAWRDQGKPWRLCRLPRSRCVDEFWNLNTPEDFAEAEQHLDALDT